MRKNRFIIFLRMNWVKLMVYSILFMLITTIIALLYFGLNKFTHLETFSRNQMASMMGIYLMIGILQAFIFVGLMQAGHYYMSMGGGMTKMLGGDAAERSKTDVKWSDVVGMNDAKREAWEVVQLMKDSKKLKAIGGRNIKGAIMIGAPGCGKTYLAKAMATEADLPFLSAVGSEFVGMIVGLGAARMKSLFKKARKMAKVEGGCIIFIDEIDSFARPRTEDRGFGGATSQNATVNQFLTELDGMRQHENNIFVLAATNVPEEDLDSAIMRSGRFDRKIRFEKPTAKGREALFEFYLKKIDTQAPINVEDLAERSQWFSPSDINSLVREAAIVAQRDGRTKANNKDLDEAMEKIMDSIEKTDGDKILSNKINIPWDSVIGMENAKKEAWEVVELLRDRHKLNAVGGKIVKGVIMLGPPGCGKTYLAKAMATEAGFPFIARTGSDFVRMFVGEGARKVEQTFDEARKLAKTEGGCIIFIDEIDAFAQPRTTDQGFGGTSSMNATVNQFLSEMDGLRRAENNIVVLAATNVAENMIDSAVMRPGRFDRKIYVTLPNLKEREELFKFYLANVNADKSCNPKLLAQKTLYFSPSQIDSMIREAGIFALREKRDTITFKDLSNAYDRIQYGDKSNIMMTDDEKIWTAYHEAGHAIIGYLLHPTDDIIKATIIPRKGSLGMVSSRPIEETHSANKEKLLADIKVAIAAYVAERVKFGSTSSGVGGGRGSDFDTAMRIAQRMVWSFGMGPTGLVGDFYATNNQYGQSNMSEKTKETLDNDVQSILKSCINEVEEILTSKKDLLEAFSQELLEKQELEYDEIVAIFDKFDIKPAARPNKKSS